MFSGLSVIEALCILVASSIYNALYPVTYKVYPGFCFFHHGTLSRLSFTFHLVSQFF